MAAPLRAAVVAAALLAAQPVAAQNACTSNTIGDPPRTAYDCGGGILIEREAAAAMGVPVADIAADTPTATLASGAMLVSVAPGAGGFQVRTPHAIASVRGTVFFVDVTLGGTAVFVTEGIVAVTGGGSTVSLGPGEGVDVAASAAVPQPRAPARAASSPLRVNRWGQARADALLARFGR